MSVEQKQSAKSAFIEKLLFALLPLLMAGVGYLLNAVSQLSHQVTVLESKVSLVVTSDNKQASNTGAELARERLRQDLTEAIQKNRDSIHTNQQEIAVLKERLKVIEGKK
jgi:flagellar motility protein MotE (MotC chaperone)